MADFLGKRSDLFFGDRSAQKPNLDFPFPDRLHRLARTIHIDADFHVGVEFLKAVDPHTRHMRHRVRASQLEFAGELFHRPIVRQIGIQQGDFFSDRGRFQGRLP